MDRVSLAIAAGQVTCLLGPSGCGKTTTMRIAAGVDRQDTGDVLVDGVVISDAHRHMPPEARGIGLMFQDFALFPHLTVAENVAFGLKGDRQAKRILRASVPSVFLPKPGTPLWLMLRRGRCHVFPAAPSQM